MSSKLRRHARGLLCSAVIALSWVTWSGAPAAIPGQVSLGAQAAPGPDINPYINKEALVVRRLRRVVVDPGHDAVTRRHVAGVRVDGAGTRRSAGHPQPRQRPGIPAAARHDSGVYARRQVPHLLDRADQSRGREGAAGSAWPRRRWTWCGAGGRERAGRECAATHRRRHHDAGDGAGRDVRAYRDREHADRIVNLGRAASRPRRCRRPRRARRGWWARRTRRRAASGGRWRRSERNRTPRAAAAPSARTTAPI